MTTRETLDKGISANDGTGDTLRSGGTKIDNNFLRVWLKLGGDSSQLSPYLSFDSDEIVFEGPSIDANNTRLRAVNPTSVNTILIPDDSGTIILTSGTQTLAGKTLTDPVLDAPQINDSDGSFQYFVTPAGGLAADRVTFLPILGDSDTFVFEKHNQTLTNKTLIAPVLTNPQVSGSIDDANGADMITFNPTGSAVLGFDMTNAATAGIPALGVAGTDSDIDMAINGKNRGAVRLSKMALRKGAAITSAATAQQDRSFIDINSGVVVAITVADGTLEGEIKTLVNRGAGTATVTPTNFGNGTSFQLAQNEAVMLIWNGINWYLNGNQSVVTIS